MAFLKPQNPMTKGSDYFYPLTTADQVIIDGGYRLNDIVGKVKKSTITLYANGWSAEAPYYYSVTVDGLSDKVNMKMLPQYPDDFEGKQAMKEETAKISFASRNGNILTFECWEEVPTIDIPVDIEIDITYPSKGLEVELNYSVVGGTTEPEEPNENMIWINTDVEITSHIISKNEPSNPVEGMVWISDGDNSSIAFHSMKIANTYVDEVYPISAKQYVSGSWVDKVAKSYQSGKWTDWWNGNLYDAGNEYEKITGGWGAADVGYVWTSDAGPLLPVTKNDDNMIISYVTGSKAGVVGTKDKIDVTGYSQLKMLYSATGTSKNDGLALLTGRKAAISVSEDVAAYALIQQGNDLEISVSLDGLSDNMYYIVVTADGSTTTIKKIWLE